MKKISLFTIVTLATCLVVGCQPVVENSISVQMPTPTLANQTKPLGDAEREQAYDFFYELKNLMALGEYEHFAENIRYPITINMDDQSRTFVYVADVEANFAKLFSPEDVQDFISTDESELIFTPEGVKLPNDKLWFNLICTDPECEDAEFLITKINN